ncbi:MAG TPA: 16S rRNA (adenine(1518)-N(6)/adenine(1519)-N(6))-dimethyltransferase RsmA [Acidobacteriota bacterium]|nr:16S rRNA (adenine(1518)-N(6)/adenine(1519)-N(6))-dimethyltransferase RsmA [Acidobacteriota bacterium]
MTVRPKKSLGQHFLTDENICRKIVRFAHLAQGDPVIEIGPGTGRLTRALLQAGARVRAVEVDPGLASRLQEGEGIEANLRDRLEIVQGDILSLTWNELLDSNHASSVEDTPVKIVGNLPYNIASRILLKMIEARRRFQRAVFMVQKEVAERVAAGPGGKDYGSLTLALQYHFKVEMGFDVRPGSFQPPPKVMSSVLALSPLKEQPSPQEAEAFHRLVRLAFRHRRKTLYNNLKDSFQPQSIRKALEACGLEPQIRPEQVDLQSFGCLCRVL